MYLVCIVFPMFWRVVFIPFFLDVFDRYFQEIEIDLMYFVVFFSPPERGCAGSQHIDDVYVMCYSKYVTLWKYHVKQTWDSQETGIFYRQAFQLGDLCQSEMSKSLCMCWLHGLTAVPFPLNSAQLNIFILHCCFSILSKMNFKI